MSAGASSGYPDTENSRCLDAAMRPEARVLEFLSVLILLFSFVFPQLLHFVSWVNENPHTCHA